MLYHCMSEKQKIVHSRGPCRITLGICVCLFFMFAVAHSYSPLLTIVQVIFKASTSFLLLELCEGKFLL